MRPHLRPVLAVVLTAGGVVALAAAYDSPRAFQASELLTPAQVKGPQYSVTPAVKTEGYFHVFNLTTDYGAVEAEGKSLLLVRISEVGSLAELDKVSKSEVFLKSAGASVLNVGKGVKSVVADPKATAAGVGAGVKRFGTNLGRKAKRTADDVTTDTPDEGAAKSTADTAAGVAGSVVGINGSARKWAQKVGADPYTTNPVLKKALSDIGKIDAAGGLAAKIVVPIPPVVSGTASVGKLVWAQDPEALLKANEAKLAALGVSGDASKKLYVSKGFTLTLHTRLATALSEVNVPGVADYVATAAEATEEREALFFVESAEMLAALHKTSPVAAVLTDSRALIAKTKDGRAIALLPLDYVSWTAAYEKALTDVAARVKAELGATKLEMRLTGTMSPVARTETQSRGWTVAEKAATPGRAE